MIDVFSKVKWNNTARFFSLFYSTVQAELISFRVFNSQAHFTIANQYACSFVIKIISGLYASVSAAQLSVAIRTRHSHHYVIHLRDW